jgi:hypothetical protein
MVSLLQEGPPDNCHDALLILKMNMDVVSLPWCLGGGVFAVVLYLSCESSH